MRCLHSNTHWYLKRQKKGRTVVWSVYAYILGSYHMPRKGLLNTTHPSSWQYGVSFARCAAVTAPSRSRMRWNGSCGCSSPSFLLGVILKHERAQGGKLSIRISCGLGCGSFVIGCSGAYPQPTSRRRTFLFALANGARWLTVRQVEGQGRRWKASVP